MSIVSKFLLRCVVLTVVLAVGAGEAQTPNIAWYAASATSYTISTADQLAGLAVLVNRDNSPVDFAGKTITLADSIDLSGYKSGKGWAPIGDSDKRIFKGFFSGNGKKISGLSINDGTRNYVGLFGNIGSGAKIEKLGVVGVSVSGSNFVGAVVGRAGDSANVTNCYSTGTVSGSMYVGGLVGHLRNGSNISNCYSTCAVNGTSNRTGGITGAVDSSHLSNSVALNPRVIGSGFVGRVAGSALGGGTIAGNMAINTMINKGGNTTWSGNSHGGLSGADITATYIANNPGFEGKFLPNNGWTTSYGKLPGFGTAEPMPEHLKPINAQAPTITQHPVNAKAEHIIDTVPNRSGRVYASATSPDRGTLSYQWYAAKSATSTIDAKMIEGANIPTYYPPTDVIGRFYYYVEVTNTIADNGDGATKYVTVSSNIATFTVATYAQLPLVNSIQIDAMIATTPENNYMIYIDATIARGSAGDVRYLTADLVSVDGGELSYQWYTTPLRPIVYTMKYTPIEGATSATYAAPIDKEGEFHYTLITKNTIANNGLGESNTTGEHSSTFTLRVAIAAEITLQPADTTVSHGTEHCLSVNAYSPNGGTLTYQWYMSTNGSTDKSSKVEGADGKTLCRLANTTESTSYYVVVTNTTPNNEDGGLTKTEVEVVSEIATLTFVPADAVLSQVREAPLIGPSAETAVIAPITALTSGLTVGPNPTGRGGTVSFFYSGSRITGGTLLIYDASGNFVKKLSVGDNVTAGDSTRRPVGSWDLMDYRLRPVGAGSYLAKGSLFTSSGKREKVLATIAVR